MIGESSKTITNEIVINGLNARIRNECLSDSALNETDWTDQTDRSATRDALAVSRRTSCDEVVSDLRPTKRGGARDRDALASAAAPVERVPVEERGGFELRPSKFPSDEWRLKRSSSNISVVQVFGFPTRT